jgi:hypothetical protein
MPCEYPLQWPAGWPRTNPFDIADSKHRFRRGRGDYNGERFWTLDAAVRALEAEIRMIGGEEVYITTNYRPSKSMGTISEERGRPKDQGVAVYFQLKNRAMVMAQDAHRRAEENLRSLALAIEAMRALERHGGGTMREKAFTGFAALPPPKTCWQILGIGEGASVEAIQTAWRLLVAKHHPDRPGGSHDAVAEVNRARDDAMNFWRNGK